MKDMLQRLAIIAILAVSVWAITMNIDTSNRLAFACTCVEIKPPQAAFEESNAVFSGKIVDIETTDDYFPSIVATFDVYTVWKGISQDPVTVTTGMGGGDCGYPFEENEEYLVYAHGEESVELQATSCSQTKPLDRAEADLVVLGEGDSTFAEDNNGAAIIESPIMHIPFPYLIGIGAAIASVIAFLTLRKRK